MNSEINWKNLALLLGVIVVPLMIILALTLSFAILLAMGFASSIVWVISLLLIVGVLLILGLITSIGVFKLNRPSWRKFFMMYSFFTGIAALISFFIIRGAMGSLIEWLVFGIGIVYLLLGFVVQKIKDDEKTVS
ncbi:hypothetical protein [Robertmurraya kyonggiensis]|uniref:Uncharacterized protein n=1 Tax=Robertmurraya kyonggiensis TaxID=1037680 RepID=A0A4U1D9X1_9BACI|nr:hypothetical protein [Robertmurraya kyonggiensis]TKC18918.1 hypothetical protein FA727_05045 [Robertmurraya kyonggiensis]